MWTTQQELSLGIQDAFALNKAKEKRTAVDELNTMRMLRDKLSDPTVSIDEKAGIYLPSLESTMESIGKGELYRKTRAQTSSRFEAAEIGATNISIPGANGQSQTLSIEDQVKVMVEMLNSKLGDADFVKSLSKQQQSVILCLKLKVNTI